MSLAYGQTVYNPQLPGTTANTWADAVLQGLNIAPNAKNERLLIGWATAESGGGSSTACAGRYNPLNSTEGALGYSCQGGSQGDIKGYATMQQGVDNLVYGLTHGGNVQFGYPAILDALRTGDQQAFINAVGSSAFGTSSADLSRVLGGTIPTGTPTEAGSALTSSADTSATLDSSSDPCIVSLPGISLGPFDLGGGCLLNASRGRALLGGAAMLAGGLLVLVGVALMAASSRTSRAILGAVPGVRA